MPLGIVQVNIRSIIEKISAKNLLLNASPSIVNKFIFSAFKFIFIMQSNEKSPIMQNAKRVEYFIVVLFADINKVFSKQNEVRQ